MQLVLKRFVTNALIMFAFLPLRDAGRFHPLMLNGLCEGVNAH